jgi:DNA-binding PadR family transcriptional regulator
MAALSPMAIAALGLLAERPMHPYEMYQLLLEREEHSVLKVRPGTLYHTVDRLARDGLVRPLHTEREGNRPERTTFEITEPGRRELSRRLLEMLSAPAREYPEFPLAISEAHNLSATQVIACLRTRIQALRDEERHVEERFAALGTPDVPRLYWLNVDYDRAVRAAQLAWLQRIVDELESGELPWRDSPEVRAHSARQEAGHAGPTPGVGPREKDADGAQADAVTPGGRH